jgi:tetratricopeptide (TPR) repeat protein
MKRAVAGALGAGVLACGLAFGVHVHRQRQLAEAHIDVDPLLQALAAAKRPPAASASVTTACNDVDACRCAEAATRAALDADLHELAGQVLEAARARCGGNATLLGQHAETQARSGASDTAQRTAELALKADSKNAYAELAQARVSYDKNQMGACSEHAARALEYGRGPEAERWLGRCTLARSMWKEAEAHFAHLLAANPNDAEAAFSDAVCNDQLGNYLGAREGFLQTLRIDPKHQRARIYLVVLTFKAGAREEARHHLKKLAELVPPDSPQLLELEKLFASAGQDGGAPDVGAFSEDRGKLDVHGKL